MSDPLQIEQASREAIERNPGQASLWAGLGAALLGQSRWEEAASAFQQALAIEPHDAITWSNLGAAWWAAGRLHEAENAYARSAALSRDSLPILRNYARLLVECGQPQQALMLLEEVLNRDRGSAAAWLEAGRALQILGEMPQAIAAYRQALAIDPENIRALYGLARLLIHHGSLAEAERLVDRIVAGQSTSADTWSLVAALRQRQLRDREAAEALRQALAIQPDPVRHSNLLHTLQYAEDVSPERLLLEHRQWDARYAAPLYPDLPLKPSASAGTRLRIGLVSADFGRHPTGFLALRPVECLDKALCSVTCYYDRLVEDEYTARFRAAADAWHVIQGWSNEQLAEQVRRDEIDVLIDLMGHSGTRLLAFARKPAAVQVTWLGYVGTTGLKAMDYLLADRFHVLPGEEGHYAERILRMPGGYACYGPPRDYPEVSPLAARASGHVTFGCFNNAAKLSEPILDAWAEILRRVPTAQLLLKNRSFDQPELRDRFHAHFAHRGIGLKRILLEGSAPHRELLDAYGRVDVALDTQPYSGGLTTCEALWMGVPVITFPGRTFAGRHSVSHLNSAGLPEFVAADLRGYIDRAVDWAGRLDELAELRAQLRQRVSSSPLCDAPRFASDLLSLLRQACSWSSTHA